MTLIYHSHMESNTPILEIAINTPLRRVFDYLSPPEPSDLPVVAGQRVEVPFGKQSKVGILLKTKQRSDVPADKLKPATQLLDDSPLFTDEMFKLCLWASDYYHHSLGEVLQSCLPVALRKGRKAELKDDKRLGTSPMQTSAKLKLNSEQQTALNRINEQHSFDTFLLEGVTGSGKTEVYMQCIETVLARNQQALVLIPEIGLTPQTVSRFETRFGVPISMLHSGLTEKQRCQEWLNARHGISRIIIGTRSAILTPLPELGMIIIDEEHDSSFKQQSGFRYCARSLAIMRAKMNDIPIILGSATPSLETLYNAQSGRYQHCILSKRAGAAHKPTFHLLDMRGQRLENGLSPQLEKKVQQHIQANNQVLLFLNRRGYAPTLLCHECGWVAECPHCDAKMTYHANSHDLHCHHCSTRRPRYSHCLSCKSKELITLGVGTEKLEEYLTTLFPDTPVIRIDRDTTSKRDAIQDKIKTIQQGGAQILVGTQMLAKGHHFPNVTMVGIIDADSGLLSSDFRALEKLGQTLLQVAGRAGREEKKGEVYLQTYCPNNPLLQQLLKEGYRPFAEAILEQRRFTKLPPFSYLVMLRAEARSPAKTDAFLADAKRIAQTHIQPCSDIQIFGPIPAAMLRKGGQYRAQLIFKSSNRAALQKWLHRLMMQYDDLKSGKNVRWSIDIDPQEILQ